jgi:FkbM family methyltransferase
MGFYERQETAILIDILRSGMCVVDVGANWGYYTLLAAQIVGSCGRVISLEPHPSLFKLLDENIRLNNLTSVTPLCIAASNRDGEMNLAGFDESQCNSGTSRLTETASEGVNNFRVKSRLLEPLLDAHNIGDVDLLKIDIEGGEGLVVPTLHSGLSQRRFKRILIELHPAALTEMKVTAASLIQMILSYGYQAWRIDHSMQPSKRAAYQLPSSASNFLTKVDHNDRLDDWPHILFLAAGVGMPCQPDSHS